MPKKLEGGAIIYQMQFGLPKYLLVHLQNWEWGFPKGPISEKAPDNLDNIRQAAIKNVKRQTNLDIKPASDFKKTLTYQPAKGPERQVTFFLAKVKEHVIVTPPKHLVMDYGWFDYRTAYRTLYYDNLRNVFYDANQKITKG